jgi:hypothetical protein
MESAPASLQQLRGSQADAETFDRIYLFKNVAALRATYQIRLLALNAGAIGKKLVLKVPRFCRFDDSLSGLIEAMPGVIDREDLP